MNEGHLTPSALPASGPHGGHGEVDRAASGGLISVSGASVGTSDDALEFVTRDTNVTSDDALETSPREGLQSARVCVRVCARERLCAQGAVAFVVPEM